MEHESLVHTRDSEGVAGRVLLRLAHRAEAVIDDEISPEYFAYDTVEDWEMRQRGAALIDR